MTAKNGSNYRLRTFGGLSIDAGDVLPADIVAQRKGLALLALLAVAGDRGVTREKIFGYLWPESDTARAGNALSQLLFRLRRDLGSDAITGNGELRIGSVVASDVGDFEKHLASGALEDGARVYTGPFLDGFYLKDAPEFERWVEEQRQRLAIAFGKLLEDMAATATQAKRHADAARWWQRRAAQDPLSARVARLYVEALVAAGDPAAALRHAEQHAALVRSELGAGTDPALTELAARIRKDAPVAAVIPSVSEGSAVAVPGGPSVILSDSHGSAVPPRPKTTWRAATFALIGIAATGIVFTSLASADARPGHVAIAPFVNMTGDTTLDALTELLSHSTAKLIEGTNLVKLVDNPAADAALRIEATVRRDRDSLIVVSTVTRRGRDGHRRRLAPVIAAQSDRDLLIDRVGQHVTGAVAALADTRMQDLVFGTSLPRYDAYLAYLQGVEATAKANGGWEDWARAARLDTAFLAPRLLLLQVLGARQLDSVFAWFEARRGTLSRADQLHLDANRARIEQRLEDYYDFSDRFRRETPGNPLALWTAADAGLATRHYAAVVSALHELRASSGWHKHLWSSWQMDIDAHHMLGNFRQALTESEAMRTELGTEETTCVFSLRQYGAMGRGPAIDSLVDECVRADVQPDRGRMGGRTQLSNELYRWAGRELLWHGHRAEGERILRKALQSERDRHATDSTFTNGWLSAQLLGDWPLAYSLMRADQARGGGACQDRDRRPVCSMRGRTRFAVTAARAGDTAVATATLAWIAAQKPTEPMHLVERAKILLALGRREQSLRNLREAALGVSAVGNMHLQTDLLELRDDRSFKALLAPRR